MGKSLKALVPIVLGLLFQALGAFGVEIPNEFKVSLLGLVSSILVWLVPNSEG